MKVIHEDEDGSFSVVDQDRVMVIGIFDRREDAQKFLAADDLMKSVAQFLQAIQRAQSIGEETWEDLFGECKHNGESALAKARGEP